jgi:hypothetical protein
MAESVKEDVRERRHRQLKPYQYSLSCNVRLCKKGACFEEYHLVLHACETQAIRGLLLRRSRTLHGPNSGSVINED